MTVSSDSPASWRVLAIYGKSADANAVPQVNVAHSPGPGLRYEVLNLESPTLASIQTAINDFKPNILYIWAGAGAAADTTTAPLQSIMLEGQDELLPEDLPELVAGHGIHGLVLNMVSEGIPQAEIRQHVPFLIRWSPAHEVTALNAATFAHMLFSLLAMTCVTFAEAFALANHVLRAYACADTGAKRDPFFPILDSTEPPELPGSKPHPAPQLEGVDLSLGFSRSVPGWEDTRLLAPVAECSLLLTSAACILDTERLAALGLALRSLCCLEVRRTRVREVHAMNYSPQHIVSGTSVAAVVAETVSGATFPLVLGVPAQVLSNQGLLEAALQATLTCDAISLRFQLPPHGSTPPQATANSTIAHSTKCIPALITTSVWVVNLLRSLASSPQNRLLALLGIGMVGNQPVAGFSLESAKLFSLLQMQQPVLGHIPQITYSRFNQASGPPSALWDMNADVPFVKPERGKGKAGGGAGGGAARETKFDELTANAAPVEQWASNRPPLPQCTPQTFMNDLINFLTTRFGWTIHPGEFPNSVLNGNPLDLFNLYRSVVDRGGFRMGNAINWKGEVFTKMANWTADHKMTGVGNALKRHYRKLLWEYERANQRDIAGDKCSLCHGGTESGTDWVACGLCQRWQHINCDPRSNLGSLADYAEGGKPFFCPDCSKIQAKPDPGAKPPVVGVAGGVGGVGVGATSLTDGAGAPVATQQIAHASAQMNQGNMGQMGTGAGVGVAAPGTGGAQIGGYAGGMHAAQAQMQQGMQGVVAGGAAGMGGAQHAQHAQQMAPQDLQPMQGVTQQISMEQFMGQNPNTMPNEALPATMQQQQQQAQHFQQQQAYGAQHAQHAQMAAQQQMQHMQGQPQYQPPR